MSRLEQISFRLAELESERVEYLKREEDEFRVFMVMSLDNNGNEEYKTFRCQTFRCQTKLLPTMVAPIYKDHPNATCFVLPSFSQATRRHA